MEEEDGRERFLCDARGRGALEGGVVWCLKASLDHIPHFRDALEAFRGSEVDRVGRKGEGRGEGAQDALHLAYRAQRDGRSATFALEAT